MSYEAISESVIAYDDMINELCGTVTIMGVDYDPARLLRDASPLDYKTHWIDWLDSEGIDSDDLEDDYTFEIDAQRARNV